MKKRGCRKMSKIVILGAGHVGKALYDVFYSIKWHVTVVDPRKDLNTEESYPFARRIVSEYKEGLEKAFLAIITLLICTENQPIID